MRAAFHLLPIAVLVGLTQPAAAQPELPDVLPNEFKCMSAHTRLGGKFIAAKTKCVIRCATAAFKGAGTYADCLPPFGGATALCIDDPVSGKGAENKFELSLMKACVTGPGADCPECYAAGCGASQAQDTVLSFESEADAVLLPNVFCEEAEALASELKCQVNAGKAVAKQFAAAARCYTKCFTDARSGGDTTACLPPVTDTRTVTCLTAARDKATLAIRKYCDDTRVPGSMPECYPGLAPEIFAAVVDTLVMNRIAPTFCASPNGAFVD